MVAVSQNVGILLVGLILFLFTFGILSTFLSIIFDKPPERKIIFRKVTRYKYDHDDAEESASVILDDNNS